MSEPKATMFGSFTSPQISPQELRGGNRQVKMATLAKPSDRSSSRAVEKSSLSVLPSHSCIADAESRPAKKRCRDGRFDVILPQGEVSTWYTGFGTDTHGTSNCGISTWPETGLEAANFQPNPLWPEVTRQWDVLPNTFRYAAESQPLADAWISLASGHTAFGFPSSPVDHMTADPFSPLVGPQGTYSLLPASASSSYPSFYPGPTQPHSLAGTGSRSTDGVSLSPGSGYSCPSGGQSTYETSASSDQGRYQPYMHEVIEPISGVGPDLGHFITNAVPDGPIVSGSLETFVLGDMSTLARCISHERRLPDAGAMKQLNDDGWIKNEIVERSDCDERGTLPVDGPSNGSYFTVSQELARNSNKKNVECLRKETSNTRSMGACLRCHNQRVRCIPNKLDRNSPLAPCETCLKVRRDTKKTIHNLPCLRFKVTSMATYRWGGLELTQRFTHTKVVDVTEYADNIICDVEIAQGLCHDPLRIQVRRFEERDTDVLNRKYIRDGIPKVQRLEPFCLADAKKAATELEGYIHRNALEGLTQAVKDSDDIVKQMFAMIARQCDVSPDSIKFEDGGATKEKKSPDQRDFLLKIVRLWFTMRHGTGSAWICGKEVLGMTPDPQVYVPRMIVAQFDSIRHEHIYKKLTPQVLRTFESFLTSTNKEAWFTVFLATFLLLHQVAYTSRDRYRYTKENGEGMPQETRYGAIEGALTGFVEDVHHGAVTLLAHWQYFKRCDLMSVNWDDVRDPALRFLEPYQVRFMKHMITLVKKRLHSIPTSPAEGCWEHELFWVSKMFVSEPLQKSDWTPPEIFTRAKPSVGREVI